MTLSSTTPPNVDHLWHGKNQQPDTPEQQQAKQRQLSEQSTESAQNSKGLPPLNAQGERLFGAKAASKSSTTRKSGRTRIESPDPSLIESAVEDRMSRLRERLLSMGNSNGRIHFEDQSERP